MSESYAVFSNNCVSRRRHIRCFCDLDSPLTTSWTKENPGWRFNGCGLYKGRKGCNFLNWYHEEMPIRAKEVILSLRKRICEDKKKDNLKMKQDEDLKKKLKLCQRVVVLVVVVIMGLISTVMLKKW
ncbi:uncharacterized protein LOC131598326 [Vicia villosa]|uniref:uncharacterized protein LOC131598326 n=1 Tax=Vicia villosa TaxID=3911 RepID=UPI00273AEB28|nr:uncharacterized protein LOC131598326 [Vicia villosa]